ncbi:unnamed protein product [Echinostoma caproni]|uniref:SET domain-containing protein n=1 Tax=Echinostoma caproni TaxID=27848 RepID=A0A183AV83_9TREM|nr:unnamed protein product [Echinostoma caproni]
MPHSLVCGQLERLSLEDYANWKTLRQGRYTNSEVVRGYSCRLILFPELNSVGDSQDAMLAYACVASTPPWIIGDLAQNSMDSGKTGSPLSAFSGYRVLPKDGIDAEDYRSIAWLETNSAERSPHDLWQCTVAAVFLTHCLSDGGYPLVWSEPDCLQDPRNYQKITPNSPLPASWAAACILYHLQSLQLNGMLKECRVLSVRDASHGFGFVVDENKVIFRDNTSFLGYAVYPTMSLINHSCDPNCALVFMRDGYCGLFATEHIAKGNALSISYSVHYATHSLLDRHQPLKYIYQFECSCQACKDGQHGPDFPWDMTCSRCFRPFSLLEMRSRRSPQSKRCQCSYETKRRIVRRVYSGMRSLPQMNGKQMLLKYVRGLMKSDSSMWFENHIANLARLLNRNNLGGLITRYSLPFVQMKEELRNALRLKYGCCLMLRYDPITELLSCLTLNSDL